MEASVAEVILASNGLCGMWAENICGETVTRDDLVSILEDVFGVDAGDVDALADTSAVKGRQNLLPHAVFNTHKSESQMLRYLKQLEDKDLALNHSMISLGESASHAVPFFNLKFS